MYPFLLDKYSLRRGLIIKYYYLIINKVGTSHIGMLQMHFDNRNWKVLVIVKVGRGEYKMG